MGIRLDDLKGAKDLSGHDFVLKGKGQVHSRLENSYNIRKFTFFQRVVRFIKRCFSRNNDRYIIREMRRNALLDLENYPPIVDACDHGSVCNKEVKKEIEGRLTALRENGGSSRKFFVGVQELVKFVENEGTTFSGSKRSTWTNRTNSLRTRECSRYIKTDGWDIKFVEGRIEGSKVPGNGNDSSIDKMCGRAALDCMTSVLLADGELQHSAYQENSGEHLVDDALAGNAVMENRERMSTAMAFLKFLTVEPHGNKTAGLFKWSGPNDVAETEKSKFMATAFSGIAQPEGFSADSKLPCLSILVPEKKLQQHVVKLLGKFPYKAGKGIAIDKRKLQVILKNSGGGHDSLTKAEQKWVAKELFKFVE